MAKRTIFLGGLFLVFCAAAAHAVPRRMNYQGKLLDNSSNPRNGTFTVNFSIWDSGPDVGSGNQLWSSEQTLNVVNGVISTQLGRLNPLPASVFSSTVTYLQIQIDGETATQRQRLVTSPYAFRAAMAEDLLAGDTEYIQNTGSLQTDSVFHVTSATVAGPMIVTGALTVGDVLVAGSGGVQITTPAGLLDASKLSGTISPSQISGTYPNITAGGLLAGDTDYVQNRSTLQSGTSFYVTEGRIAGPLTATGTVSLGGAAGVHDVTVNSDLTVAGDLQVSGNDLLDSGGTSRLALGSSLVLNGSLTSAAGTSGLSVSTPVYVAGAANKDNYIAFPFTAGGTIAAKDIVIISGANTVNTTTTAATQDVIGIAVNSALLGETVYVAMVGIVTDVVTNGAVTQTNFVCTSTTAGRVDDSCNTNGAPIGKALTGATLAGQTITVALFQGR